MRGRSDLGGSERGTQVEGESSSEIKDSSSLTRPEGPLIINLTSRSTRKENEASEEKRSIHEASAGWGRNLGWGGDRVGGGVVVF